MGRARDVEVRITDMTPPHRLAAQAAIEGVTVAVDIVLTVTSPTTTRLTVTTEAAATGIAGRLLLAAAGAMRDRLGGRYARQIAGLAKRIGHDPNAA